MLSAENQQERLVSSLNLNISNQYLAGFVDGEGCFYVGIVPSKDNLQGWQIITEFHVSQNPSGKVVLEGLKDRLGCGYLKPNHAASSDDKSLVFIVKSRSDLIDKVIPFFERNPLYSDKKHAFLKFKKIVEILQTGRHLELEGFKEVLDLAYSMNTTRRRVSKEKIILRLKSSQAIR